MPGISRSTIVIRGLTDCPLASQIVLAFCDLDGSGLKALGLLVPKAGYRAHYHELGLSCSGEDLTPSPSYTLHAGGNPVSPLKSYLTLVNVYPEDQPDRPKVTLLALNTWLPHRQQSQVLAALMESISTSQAIGATSSTKDPCSSNLIILASTLIKSGKDTSGVCLMQTGLPALNISSVISSGTHPLSTLSYISASTQLQDHMLALLQHMASCADVRATFLLIPGHRPEAGSISNIESLEGAKTLCAALLEFSEAAISMSLPGGGESEAPYPQLAACLEIIEARGQDVQLQNPWFWHGRFNNESMLLCEGMYC
jgi:hypothetical protein